MNQSIESAVLTAQEVSRLLKISLSTIYFYAAVNKLPSVRVGKHLRFPTDQIEALVHGKGGRR